MPYILAKDRPQFEDLIKNLSEKISTDPAVRCGQLNYIITRLLVKVYGLETRQPRYAEHNEVIGMLECCKAEYYRHIVGIYEEKKIAENGDTH